MAGRADPASCTAHGPTPIIDIAVAHFLTCRKRTSGYAGIVMFSLLVASQAPSRAYAGSSQEEPSAGRGRILLVLPFDNRTGQPNLEWVREAAAELLSSRFTSAGFSPMSRQERMYALDHLGLPEGFQPSRASSLKLAQTLDADSIVVGSFVMDGNSLVAEARVVDVPHLRMSEPVSTRGDLHDLIAVFDLLAWKLTRTLDPGFSVAEETFVAAGKAIRLDAFEQYIRGITEPDHDERLRHLRQAVALSPDFGAGWMALGREDYAGEQYEDAANAFAKVGRNEPDALEAGFYRGLSLLFSGNYPQAEDAFSSVAKVLPLPEVLNNEAVAISRQDHDGSALFVDAETADPNNADYHFNLAVSLKHRGFSKEASAELVQCLKLRPNDAEAVEVEKEWNGAPPTPATGGDDQATSPDVKADPLERIVRTFDAAAFRQAANMMDQVQAARMGELAPRDRALKLASQAKDFLDRGLLLEAERLYQAAVVADGSVAEAHAGLAEVRERSGDAATARAEAEAALKLQPSAESYLVLGRLDLAANHLEDAGKEANEALQLDPGSSAAQDLSRKVALKVGKQP
jgi:tetratricopeptide (TPR) repeat protein